MYFCPRIMMFKSGYWCLPAQKTQSLFQGGHTKKRKQLLMGFEVLGVVCLVLAFTGR